MMDKAKLLERLMATFLDELDEHVRAINDELMALEKNDGDDRDERLKRLFRAAHSLKGASRAVDLPGIEQVCHRIEDVFTELQKGRLQPTAPVCSVLFRTADAIESAGMQLREKSVVNNAELGRLVPALESLCRGEVPEMTSVGDTQSADADEAPKTETVAHVTTPPLEESAEPGVRTENLQEQNDQETLAVAVPRAHTLPTTVRVAEDKLDSLLAQSGELLVARQRVEARPQDLDPIMDMVAHWRTEWRSVIGTLRHLVHQETTDPLVRRSSRLRERVADAIEQNGERLSQLERSLESLSRDLIADSRQLKQASSVLQDDIHRIRMLPFAEACAGLERAVRDVCRATGKEIELILEGGDIEVDRSVLEGLSDPLMHLVRNAIDHGIEPAAERAASGKPIPAKVRIRASIEGAEVAVVVVDDGQGLQLDKIRQRLRSLNLAEPADEQELARSIFLPGFSTAQVVTDVSGRGVGMDVVKNRIESLHGRIDISTQAGFGTRFSLYVPLTLTTVSALFIRCGDWVYALPTTTVARLVRFDISQVKHQQGESVLCLGEIPVPVVSLADILGVPETPAATSTRVAVLTTTGERQMLFVVDEVLAEQEAVVKSLGRRIRRVPHVSGAITLRSGKLALLLNTANLTRAQSTNGSRRLVGSEVGNDSDAAPEGTTDTRRVLVVDDSMTTRALLKSILETAGYDVTAASDGLDAWQQLQTERVDIVVSDVDMPGMSGFELTERIRQSSSRGHLPVILVTSRDSDADKARGVEVGADAYLIKSSFDQSEILETVEQFL